MTRRHTILISSLLLLGLCRLAWGADLLALYNGEASVPPAISLGNWGTAGSEGANPCALRAVTASRHAIPITTRGRYQGLRVDCTPPLDITPLLITRETFLELYLCPATALSTGSQPTLPAWGGLRVTLCTEHGIGVLAVPDAQLYPAEVIEGAWIRIDLPLARLSGAVGGTLSRLLITTEQPAAFALGRLAVVRDDAPLTGRIRVFPAHPAAGQALMFVADIDSGAAPATARWHFASAGDTVDATGEHVTYRYATPGAYTVTCTLRDVLGVKAPVTVTQTLTVSADLPGGG